MKQNTSTCIKELENYLNNNNYFDDENNLAEINQVILAEWGTKMQTALKEDINTKFNNVELNFTHSEFELSSEDEQGACVLFHKASLTDNETSETLKINIKSLINYDKTNIYLDSIYATIENLNAESALLKSIFRKLKRANEKNGFFSPILLDELLK